MSIYPILMHLPNQSSNPHLYPLPELLRLFLLVLLPLCLLLGLLEAEVHLLGPADEGVERGREARVGVGARGVQQLAAADDAPVQLAISEEKNVGACPLTSFILANNILNVI